MTSQAVARVEQHPGALQGGAGAEAQAKLLQKSWGSGLGLPPQDLEKLIQLARAEGLDPFFHLDVLGDSLYDNADFWQEALGADPRVRAVHQEALKFGTPEWEEWIGVEEEDVVAAAYLTTVEMEGRVVPVQEANYVLSDDPILGEWSDPAWFSSKDSEDESADFAGTLEREGKRVERFKTRNGWGVKFKQQKPDWRALAKKKARTTSLRRVAKIAIPRTHAKVMLLLKRAEAMQAQSQNQGAGGQVHSAPDPYAEEPEAVGRIGSGEAQVSLISENTRRALFGIASRRGVDHVGLKDIIARVQKKDASEVSTSDINYEEYAEIVAELDAMPEAPVVEAEEVGAGEGEIQDAEVIE